MPFLILEKIKKCWCLLTNLTPTLNYILHKKSMFYRLKTFSITGVIMYSVERLHSFLSFFHKFVT